MVNKISDINDNILWYKDAIIYELHIKAFMDSNGDGIGDFTGLLNRLDYLEDLGVTAIWLLPFYPSPLKDDGYDIADYYNINPSYGTIKDFKKFIKAAHDRNIKVITELVINHTSDKHPWFQKARTAPKDSAERNYYVWTDDPNKYKGVRIIFQDYEKSNWTWDPVAKQYYWHRFFHHQPDLNYDNPMVQEEVFKIIDYWINLGVDGFRLDAVPYLYQREGTNCENLPETHIFLKKLREHVDKKKKNTMLLAEANMWPEDSASYFGNGDECHMNYHFPIMPRMFMSMRMEDRYPITDIFDQTPSIPDTCQWAIFLRNHDELTLEMVTDEERDYMYKVYARNPKAKINLGIRQRLAPLLDNNRKKIEMINYLLFSLPGTPVIYYGDEIGMGDNFYLGDRDGVRTPMQWSPDRNAGFSNANPHKLYLPLILDPEHHYGTINVETQQGNSSSLLWWMKRVINMRKKFKAFSRGDLEFIQCENSKVLAFTRSYEDETILVVVNLSRFSQVGELDLSNFAGHIPVEVFSKNYFPVINEYRDYVFTLSPHDYQWFVLKKEESVLNDNEDLPVLETSTMKNVFSASNLEMLENKILPNYLIHSKWFEGKRKKIQSTKIVQKVSVNYKDNSTFIILLEVYYESGLPDLYQLSLAVTDSPESNMVLSQHPYSIICQVKFGDKDGSLYDAFYDPGFQESLFQNFAQRKKLKAANGLMRFYGDKRVTAFSKNGEEVKPRLLLSRKTDTSLIFNNKYYLKIYRKLDRAMNPDLEIVRFLSNSPTFKNVPNYLGKMEVDLDNGQIVLGMLQEAVTYQSETRSYLMDFLQRYYEVILSRGNSDSAVKLKGSLTKPIAYDEIEDTEITELLNLVSAESIRTLGKRTAQMHLALASSNDDDFKPEEFSLHYQRSLYSSFQTLVRKTFQSLNKNRNNIPASALEEANKVISLKDEIIRKLKLVYNKKIDLLKIRTHGDLHLEQVLFTGKDYIFIDFEGNPEKTHSERRLKRTALSDVAFMLSSIYAVAFAGLIKNENIRHEDFEGLYPWAKKWYHYMSMIYMKEYLSEIKGSSLVPENREDLKTLIDVFLLTRFLKELERKLRDPNETIIIPLSGILSIVDD